MVDIVHQTGMTLEAIHTLLEAYQMGVNSGQKEGEAEYKTMFRYASGVLSGDVDDSGLADSADGYYHR